MRQRKSSYIPFGNGAILDPEFEEILERIHWSAGAELLTDKNVESVEHRRARRIRERSYTSTYLDTEAYLDRS
jgi:hypothetical protein